MYRFRLLAWFILCLGVLFGCSAHRNEKPYIIIIRYEKVRSSDGAEQFREDLRETLRRNRAEFEFPLPGGMTESCLDSIITEAAERTDKKYK